MLFICVCVSTSLHGNRESVMSSAHKVGGTYKHKLHYICDSSMPKHAFCLIVFGCLSFLRSVLLIILSLSVIATIIDSIKHNLEAFVPCLKFCINTKLPRKHTIASSLEHDKKGKCKD